MNLAIIHYHLNRGGVARVIENQLLALDAVLDPADPWHAAILHGGRKEGWNDGLAGRLRAIRLELAVVPGLEYDEPGAAENAPPDEGSRLLLELTDAIGRLGFTPGETVVQIHNHSLGKNVALSASVGALAASGYNLLLQIHDFAEDFRPANYRRVASLGAETLYPQAAGIHYAVLNGRDHAMLLAAGVADERLHFLPNPVCPGGALPDRAVARAKLETIFGVGPGRRFLLYPVRAIRRKNVGEALLVGVLSPPGTVVGVTLAPLNPAERPVYAEWKDAAAELELPCRFEVGGAGALTIAENLAASDTLMTTSVAEGFGMVMLESWLTGRALVGRDLPEITSDFTAAGLRLDGLWKRLDAPLAWVGRERFADAARAAYRRAMAVFDRPLPTGWEDALRDKMSNGAVDFADLDEAMQRDVLGRVAGSPEDRREVFARNPGLEETLAVDRSSSAATIERNARVVERRFGPVPSGRRLAELLARVAGSPRGGPAARLARHERILDALLDPRRFRMIRT